MGMSLMQMGKSKSGMSYLKSQIERVKPALIGMIHFHPLAETLGEVLKCILLGSTYNANWHCRKR